MDSGFLKILYTTLKDLSFWTGFVTVFAFSMGRFNEKQHDQLELDPPFPNRCFTSRFRYLSTALIYALIYLGAYSAFVIAGSIPYLQGILTQLFGSVDSESQIGTPAWAAMVVMVIAPTIAQIKNADSRLRRWLLRFASIPYKARQLAEEIVVALRESHGQVGTDISISEAIALYEELQQLSRRLTGDGRGRTNDDYKEFFATYEPIVTNLYKRFTTVNGEYAAFRKNGNQDETINTTSFNRQFVDLVRRESRVIACAVLQSEADEFRARETLRTRGNCATLESASFRFGTAQATLGVFLVIISCVVFGPLFTWLGKELTPSEMVSEIGKWALWGVASSFAFLFPIVLAAAVQLWLLDEDDEGNTQDWPAHITMLLVTLLGCFALAAIPLFFGAVVQAALESKSYDPLLAAYALTPALSAVIFIPMSRYRTDQPPAKNVAIDFLIFGLIGGASTYTVGAILSLLKLASAGQGLAQWYDVLIGTLPGHAVVAMLICGLFGTLQCATSRRYIERVKSRPQRYSVATGQLNTQANTSI